MDSRNPKQKREAKTQPIQSQDKITRTEGEITIMSGITTTVQKWGNSLAIRIPRAVAESAALEQGSEMEITVLEDQKIELKPKRKVPTLEELVARITPENRHGEVDFGQSEGNELL